MEIDSIVKKAMWDGNINSAKTTGTADLNSTLGEMNDKASTKFKQSYVHNLEGITSWLNINKPTAPNKIIRVVSSNL